MTSATRSRVARAAEGMLRQRPQEVPPRSPAKLRCVHRCIEGQAQRSPEAVALVASGISLTYGELNARANRLARRLRTMGVGPEVLVGLCAGRSAPTVVGLLAILKAGGAYVPLDPAYPAERIAFMLQDAQVSVLLTEERLRDQLPGGEARIVWLDSESQSSDQESAANLDGGAGAGNLAYVIYTSGSTGKPKGVQIMHEALANLLQSMRRVLSINERDALLAVTTLSFDIAALEIFLPLIVGARVELVDRDVAADGARLAERASDPAITFLQATPATWRLLLEAGWQGHRALKMLCGGEALPRALADRLLDKGAGLWNVYGPTETTIWSSACGVEAGETPISIGRPIANTQFYVLDKRLRAVPVGVIGELYIGGLGLARGYRHRAALTAERFIPDPLGTTPGGRLYWTGDLARWRADGTLECLGRVDHQVKIRGFRVELGEIEGALARHPAVREAAVAARPDASGEMSLAAYIVVRDGAEANSAADLRRWLQGQLPDYMVPTAFVSLEALPLTPNGKIDRQALPDPGQARLTASADFVPPRGPVEEKIATGWGSLLGVERVGAHDNFFDLGGHSLLATQVVSRLREAFGVEIPLRALFESPTVAGLAAQIKSMKRGGASSDLAQIEPTVRDGPLPLSFSQEALWFLDQLAPGQPTFNVTAALRIAGQLDRPALERSVNELARRHDSLRTTFAASAGSPHQRVAPDLSLAIETVDLSALPMELRQAEAKRLAIAESRRPFELTLGPLARISLLRLGDSEHLVLLTMHHLITDGWSFNLAGEELITLYQAFSLGRPSPLPIPRIQYADFARWQRDQFQSGAWTTQIERWNRRLAGVPPLELPADRARPPVRRALGAQHPLVLGPELSDAVRALSRSEGVTPFMTLLAAFQLLLGRWSGQDDFAVGSPVANRTRAETERVLGYFVNMLALRADLSGNPTVREFLSRVREVSLEAFENQEIPLEVLIPALKPDRDASRSPLFQVMFILQNNALPEVGSLDLAISPLELDQGNGTSKFDLALGFEDNRDGFAGSLEFNTDLFDAATIARFAQQYVKLLEGLILNPDRHLSELLLVCERERRQVMAWSRPRSHESRFLGDRDWPVSAGIHGRFETQVEATPDRLAVVSDARRLTYSELNASANQLARHLRSLGARPDVRVGLVLASPINRIVAVLGVLKAGAAYVPIDPSLPLARSDGMLDAASVSIVIVDGGGFSGASRTRPTVVDLDADHGPIDGQSSENLSIRMHADNLAYVIFTSGTTGRPKGVMVSHRSLRSIAAAWEDSYQLRQGPLRHLQVAGFAFDVFTGDWVRALATGGTLISCPTHVALDPRVLSEMIERERIECVELVPALAEPLAAHCEQNGRDLGGLRLLAVGSDSLRGGLYARLRKLVGHRGRVVNSYGLTEATIDSTYFEGPLEGSRDDGPVPIGQPFPGACTYILDGRGELVPSGVVGELYVGGPGVARGYVDSPAQTAERFVPDPHGEPGSRMYVTGDRARWLLGGALELLGRRDDQVKVRGCRVEIAEIEAAVASCPGVREASVIAQEDGAGGQRLVACVVALDHQILRVDALRRLLRDTLPRPMIPARFEIVAALPRTPSGKVDRKTLLESLPEQLTTADGIVRPRNPVEEQLVAIWEELLEFRPIGVTDDFFDVGGHSLLAARMAARIEERFERSLPLSDLLKGSTIELLAARLLEPAVSRGGSPLVDLGITGPGLPLILVHPIGGGILCYSALARCLGGARNVLGLEADGLESDAACETDLVRMASRYVEALRLERPQGPYLLGGWSMGGIVAFEMARQLTAAGHEVPLVILIDSPVPTRARAARSFDGHESLVDFAADLARTAGRENWASLEQLRGLDFEAMRSGSLERAIEGSEISREIGAERLQRLHDVYRANRLALEGYEPRPYSGRAVLIHAGSNLGVFDDDSARGWNALALGGVTTHRLPGDHYTIMQRPTVEKLAEILSGEIESLDRTMGEAQLR